MIKPRPQKLLIIDEINYTRLVLSQALSNKGYKVGTAHNSGEAMQQIAAELPDVILLSLPATTSRASALRSLKDYFRLRLDVAQGAEPAIIILSDYRDARQMREIQSLGISHSLTRPINIQELFNSISSVINSGRDATPEKRMKIVIIDIETRSQQFLESILAHEMYDIEAADSEAEFLARIKNREYDLCIMDLVSLETDILEVLKSIKELAEEMPVMTIATSADQISQDELKKWGVHMHFIKPIHVDVFRSGVDALLQEQEEPQEEQKESQAEKEEAEKEESEKEEPEKEKAENTDQESDEQAEKG